MTDGSVGGPATGPLTVAICTRDGAARIGATLEALAAQDDPGVPWRLLVVDNGSSDGTIEVAEARWAALGSPAPLECVVEPEPGTLRGRVRAIKEAGDGVLLYVDDDNHLDPTYLRAAVAALDANAALGAVGGVSRLPPGRRSPPELVPVLEAYAIGRTTSVRLGAPMPWGAGMALRAAALQPLLAGGYAPVHGSRGDDTELCLLLRGMGWDLAVDDRMTLVHDVDPDRFTAASYRRMSRANGRTSTTLRLYEDALRTGSCATWPEAVLRALVIGFLSLFPKRGDRAGLDNRRVHALGRLQATWHPGRFSRDRRSILRNVALARACPGPPAT